MLKNRFLRLLTTILIFTVVFLPLFVKELNSDDVKILEGATLAPLLTLVVCIVGQICGDIMNVEKVLNNDLVTLLKRAIFCATVAVAVLIAFFGNTLPDNLLELSRFEMGLCIAGVYAPPFAFLAYIFSYIKDSSPSSKKWFPFFFPISYAAGVVAGVLTSFVLTELPTFVDLVGYVAFVVVAIGVTACFREEWPFEEYATTSSFPYSYLGTDEPSHYNEKISCRTCRWYTSYGKCEMGNPGSLGCYDYKKKR